jgi:hypothetical protein
MASEAMTPKRIQLSRRKGWRKPDGAVVVSRPSLFGNPFPWHKAREAGYRGTDEELKEFAVSVFREWLTANERHGHGQEERRQKVLAALPSLRGKDLCCWCKPGSACHADELLRIANAPEVPRD